MDWPASVAPSFFFPNFFFNECFFYMFFFKENIYIYINTLYIYIYIYILIRVFFLNDDYFFGYAFNFRRGFSDSSIIIIFIFYIDKLYF
jgi:hypothetical protein